MTAVASTRTRCWSRRASRTSARRRSNAGAEGCAGVSLEIVAQPPLQAGFAAGPAAPAPLLARSAQPLPAAALCHPCVAAALALVVYEAALPGGAVRSTADVARCVPAGRSRARCAR